MFCPTFLKVAYADQSQLTKDQWQKNISKRCIRDIKDSELFKNDGGYITYSPLKTTRVIAPYWMVNWEGFLVPVPDIEYSFISFKNNRLHLHSKKEKFNLVLSKNEQLSIPGIPPFFPLPQSSWAYKVAKDPQAFTLRNLTDLAYRTTPDDVTCKIEKIDSELSSILALHLKWRIAKLLSVHKVGDKNNEVWLTHSLRGKKLVDWEARKFDSSNTEFNVTIVTTSNSRFSNIGAVINLPKLDQSPTPPAWVELLQSTLTNWDEKSVRQLSKVLDIEYFDQ